MSAKSAFTPTAIPYYRFSTTEQMNGHSLERQRKRALEWCEANGVELLEGFEDLGVSAYSGANRAIGALKSFLDLVEQDKIPRGTYLLVESLDRLSREAVLDAAMQLMKLIRAGIVVVTLLDGQIYSDERLRTDWTPLIVSMAIMARAHDESETKSSRGRAVWEHKRLQADGTKLTAMAPAWLTLSGNRKSFEIIEERVAIVNRIFNESASGLGAYAITRRLNNEGVAPFGRSEMWVQSYVTKILQSRAVLGEYQPHRKIGGKRVPEGEPIEGYFPAIIEPALYLRAQHGRHTRATVGGGRKGEGLTNLFTGLAKCGYCGAAMRYINKGQNPKSGKPHLRCSTSLGKSDCISMGWSYEGFETSFFHFVSEMDIPSIFYGLAESELVKSSNDAIICQRERIKNAEEKRNRTFFLINQIDVDMSFLAERLKESEVVIAESKKELQRLEKEAKDLTTPTSADATDLKELIARLSSLPPEERYLQRSRLAAKLSNIITRVSLRVLGDEPDFLEEAKLFADKEAAKRHMSPESWLASLKTGIDDPSKYPAFEVFFKNGVEREVTINPSDATKLFAMSDRSKEGELIKLQWGRNIQTDMLSRY